MLADILENDKGIDKIVSLINQKIYSLQYQPDEQL